MNTSTIGEVTAEIRRRAPGVTTRIKRADATTIVVHLISVPPTQRGFGMGQRVLDILCAWADHEELTLALSPSGHLGSDQRRLVAWYGKAGFVIGQTAGQTMRRLPMIANWEYAAA
jgi:GNAT superfamily N-acetyltransferase